MILPQKWQFRLENENFEMSRNNGPGKHGHSTRSREFDPKSVWRSLVSCGGIGSKIHFWATLFLFEMDQNCRFELFQSGPKLPIRTEIDSFSLRKFWSRVQLQFWSTFKYFYPKWTKIAFSKQTEHVILNSFKHFSGPKSCPNSRTGACTTP